jgi:hypothetical protein
MLTSVVVSSADPLVTCERPGVEETASVAERARVGLADVVVAVVDASNQIKFILLNSAIGNIIRTPSNNGPSA